MNCLWRVHSYTGGIFRRTSHVIARSTPSQCYAPSWKTNFEHASVKTIDLEFLLTRLHVHCYSSGRSTGRKTSQRRKLDSEPEPVMDKEKDAFFVVRKGDIVGIYKSLADCQAQVGSSVIIYPSVNIHSLHCFWLFCLLFLHNMTVYPTPSNLGVRPSWV